MKAKRIGWYGLAAGLLALDDGSCLGKFFDEARLVELITADFHHHRF